MSQSATTRSLALFGNAADFRTWSNIPYFFSEAGKRAGFITHALDLRDEHYTQQRNLWRLKMLARGRQPIEFQWSRENLRRVWLRIPPELRQGEIISHLQAFPPADLAEERGRHSFYIDATLKQMSFGAPNLRWHQRDIVERETEAYHAARFLISMARETARVLTEVYKVDPRKVHVVRPGANLHDTAVDEYRARHPVQPWRRDVSFTAENPAVLGMIANHYLRKGLPKLVKIAEELARRGRPVRVCIVGNCSDELRAHPLVDDAGFIEKSNEPVFLKTLDGFAMGCLLSTIEPLGIGTLEALRLGVPVLGNRIGGIPDCVPPDAGILVEPTDTPEQIADVLEPNLFELDRYAALCAAAASHSLSVTWDTTVQNLMRIWAASEKL